MNTTDHIVSSLRMTAVEGVRMPGSGGPVHPYIPNSAPEVRRAMLDYLGVTDVSDLYDAIPAELRLGRALDLPEAILPEHDLKTHVLGLLADVVSTEDYASFLGGGCWKHFVPVVCDEINNRREFVTAYAGEAYSDHGKHQAWFEWQSLLGELLEADFVSLPTYDWMAAASSALLMTARLTGRGEVIVPRNLNPERLSHMRNYCRAGLDAIHTVGFDPATGEMDLDRLGEKLSASTAAVYFENPTFLGTIEGRAPEIVEAAHEAGALCVVGVDPISLGVMAPPTSYGADLVVGDVQPLGVHMQAGGATCGFIAGDDDPRFAAEYPTLLETITTTDREGAWGFGWATGERTSFAKRGLSEDFTGTTSGLWAITAAVYLSLLGPSGIREVGEAIMQKAHYTRARLDGLPGIGTGPTSTPFKEFVVDFTETGRTVAEINRALLEHRILGGQDLSADFPELGRSALYCVTEVTPSEHIDRLVSALGEITS